VSAKIKIPSLRHHRPSGQAVVTLSGRDVYLGHYGAPEAEQRYEQAIAEWLASGRMRPAAGQADSDSGPTVAEILVPYVEHCEGYYRRADGTPTGEAYRIKLALRPLRELYAHLPARDFGPLQLRAVRNRLLAHTHRGRPLCRVDVNRRVGMVVRAFKWAVADGLIPPTVHHGLVTVEPLRRGRSEARETAPIKPVPDAFIDAIRPHVSRQVWAMVELQRWSGMRPSEVLTMRTMDIDTGGDVWTYVPSAHKTEHHGKSRIVAIGPRGQDVLKPWLRPELEAYLFSAREAEAERLARAREKRKTRVQPSQQDRRRKRPKHLPGDRYTRLSYAQAIRRGCEKAGVPSWTPNRLRHNWATLVRRTYGLDTSRACLGHSSAATTSIYAERDAELSRQVARKLG
jgi:integrase